MKMYDILKVNITLVKSVYYIMQYTILLASNNINGSRVPKGGAAGLQHP
jgi:hypothetical protein